VAENGETAGFRHRTAMVAPVAPVEPEKSGIAVIRNRDGLV
jgi:hypothetical protein